MLFIFKKLRRSFFLPGKVRTYLAYGIGEIALIMIGILLAVQVSEWNDRRREATLAQDYILRLILDFEGEFPAFENSTDFLTMRRDFAEFLLQVAEDPKLAQERPVEFMVAVNQAGRLNTVPLNTDTIDELRSTGNLGLLDTELKFEIFQYYRRNERLKNAWDRYNMISVECLKLSRQVLSPEQERWIDKHVERVWPRDIPEIRAMHFDDPSLLDSVLRLQSNTELVAWLPRVKEMHENILRANQQLEDRLNKIIAMLKSRQEN